MGGGGAAEGGGVVGRKSLRGEGKEGVKVMKFIEKVNGNKY